MQKEGRNMVLMKKARAWKHSHTAEHQRDSKLLTVRTEDFDKFVPEKEKEKSTSE